MMSKIPHIPCVENKCLIFPVCKNKKIIKCDKLIKYIYYLLISENINNEFLGYCIIYIFPNLVGIYYNDDNIINIQKTYRYIDGHKMTISVELLLSRSRIFEEFIISITGEN